MKMLIIAAALTLVGCESLYQDDGIQRIRTQKDVDAYNATVSTEAGKLICTREFVIGTNFREFVCLTVAQRERMQQQAREDTDIIFSSNRVIQ